MPGRTSDDDDFNDRPRRKRRQRDAEEYDDSEEDQLDDYDDLDYEERRPSNKRRRSGDATGGIIPYKNSKALISYYCGVFSLIPCLGGLLGPTALILGFLGLAHNRKYPESKGTAHSIVGIILGGLVTIGHIVLVVLLLLGLVNLK